jgi:hypothetical protein
MHINRGLLFWGLALVTAGVVALAASQGWFDREVLIEAWRLWPLILIAIGLAIVLSRTPFALLGTVVAALVVGTAGGAAFTVGPGVVSCGDGPTSTETSSGDFTAPDAAVHVDLNCGELDMALGDGSAWHAVTGINAEDPAELASDGVSLRLSSEGGSFPFRRERQEWALTLGREVSYDISASLNAADSRFDLAGGRFSRISLDPNAGSVHMDLTGAEVLDFSVSLNAGSLSLMTDAETDLTGVINVNAGAVSVCAAEGTAMRFTVSANVTFAHDLDESGLAQSGDTYTSASFESAAHRIDLRLEGNAASFDLNPEDGCE